MSDTDTVTVNGMHMSMQSLEAVQDEMHQLMLICTNLVQEVKEATDLLKKILARLLNPLEQRRSLQPSVPESFSDSDDSVEMSEGSETSEAPGKYIKGVSAEQKHL